MYDLNKAELESICKALGIEVFGVTSVFRYESIYKMLSSDNARCRTGDFITSPAYFVVFAIPYKIQSIMELNHREGVGFITPMAKSYNYHKIVRDLGNILAKELEKLCPNLEYKVFVDDDRISDRILAFSAGIGKYGKNGFIINDAYGTAFNIGGIAVNVNVEPTLADEDISYPLSNGELYSSYCANCNQCIVKCPNNAIKIIGNDDNLIDPSLKIDREKCVSSISQKKGQLSLQETELIRRTKSIYGCDECQTVCPRNVIYKVKSGYNRYVEGMDDFDGIIDIDEFLKVEKSEFKKKFKNTGFAWRGYDTLSRNARIIGESWGCKNVE